MNVKKVWKFAFLDNTKNARIGNDSNSFFEEFFNLLGVKAESLTTCPTDANYITFLGDGDYSSFSDDLSNFVKNGGTIISFGSKGLDNLFGIKLVGNIKSGCEFAVNKHFITTDKQYLSGTMAKSALPIISDIRNCAKACDDVEIKGVLKEVLTPALFKRNIENGVAFYFGFSLLKTIWYKTQGRPVYEDIDGDGCCRSGDSIIPDVTDDFKIPTVDAYLHIIENIIWSVTNAPMVHQIPAEKGVPCDYAVHYCGDEDWCGKEMYDAVDALNDRGAKYHVHLQPIEADGKFTINKEQFEELNAKGLSLSLHFDLVSNGKFRYQKEDLAKQVKLFEDIFGKKPTTSNTHWFIYNGFGETSRWLKELGIKGTIKQLGISTDLFDINKMNDYGFAFGTSYPTRTVDIENDFVLPDVENLKITFYEPRLACEEDEKRIENYMRACEEFALVSNIFIHPTYFVSQRKTVLDAVDKIVALQHGKNVKVMYTDEVTSWWQDRRDCTVKCVSEDTLYIDFKVPAVVKFPTKQTLSIGNDVYTTIKKTIAGREVWLVELPSGKHTVTINK